MKRLVLFLLAVGKLLAVATPGFYQHNDPSLTWGYENTNTKFTITGMQQPTHVGNVVLINLFLAAASAPSGLAITDDASNTYTLVNSQGSATNGSFLAQYCSVIGTASQNFKAAATTDLGNAGWVKMSATEYYNSTCTVDQFWVRDATSGLTTLTFSGTKTIATSGDLLHFIAAGDNGVVQSSFTAGTGQTGIACPGQTAGNWCLVSGSGQIWDQIPQQWGVYNSTTALNPKMTVSASTQAVILCVALKASASTAGSAPTITPAPWIYGVQFGAVFQLTNDPPQFGPGNATSPVKFQFPTYGNIGVITFTGSGGTYPSAISSSVGGESWTQAQRINNIPSANAGYSAVWTACNLSPSQSRILTVTVTGGSATDNTYTFYDVTSPNTSTGTACVDTSGTNSGTQSTVGSAITQAIGPFAATNELAISVISVAFSGSKSQVQASGVNYVQPNLSMNVSGTTTNQCGSNITPPQPLFECNGGANFTTTSTSSVNAVFNPVTDGSVSQAYGDWNGAWVAIKGLSTAVTPQGTLVGVLP